MTQNSKKLKKEKQTYEQIKRQINDVDINKNNLKQNLQVINKLFYESINCTDIDEIKLNELFNICINKCEKREIDFILDVFYKSFYLALKKEQNLNLKILVLIYNNIKKKFDGIDNINEFSNGINELTNLENIENFIVVLKNIYNNQNIMNIDKNERIIYLFVYSMCYIVVKNSPNFNILYINICKAFALAFAKEDKNDKYLLKMIIASFFKKNIAKTFKSFIFLFDNYDMKLENKEIELVKLNNQVCMKIKEINYLKTEIQNLKNENLLLDKTIEKQNTLNLQLQQDLVNAENRNTFDKNIYEHKCKTLKDGLVYKIQNDLSLEIQGLRDISENLNDKQQLKINRRIDNIYKIIQKIGE